MASKIKVQKQYVALLRAITNVSMDSFRTGMEELGFTDVESYGMSGNLLFNAGPADMTTLEKCISDKFGTPAMVRTRTQVARVIAQDPFGSSILFLTRPPTTAHRRAFLQIDFESPRPLMHGKTVYFVHPARLVGKRGPFDFERELGVLGTARSSRIVRGLLERM